VRDGSITDVKTVIGIFWLDAARGRLEAVMKLRAAGLAPALRRLHYLQPWPSVCRRRPSRPWRRIALPAARHFRYAAKTRSQDRIRAVLAQNGYTINNQLPFNQLTARSGSAANGMATLGLTVTNGQYAVKLGGTMLQDAASGYECIAPRVELALNYSPVLIYVATSSLPVPAAIRRYSSTSSAT
jgi:hypothetical protein